MWHGVLEPREFRSALPLTHTDARARARTRTHTNARADARLYCPSSDYYNHL